MKKNKINSSKTDATSQQDGNLNDKVPETRRSTRKSKIQFEPEMPKKPKTKVYVYVQLKSIENIPRTSAIEVELSCGGTPVPRLDCDCTKAVIWDLRKEDPTTTFSFPIVQDSVDDLNMMSDHPILITLFQHITPASAGDQEEYESEYRKVYAQGYIDILAFFTKKRFSSLVDTFLYPADKTDHITFGIVKTSWHIYALLPLLKNIDFSNLIFINFESVYNPSEDLLDDPDDLMAVLAFRSLVRNSHGYFETNKICSFSGFNASIIKEQNPFFTWEAAKTSDYYTGQNFGLQTESKVNVYNLFKRVLRPEGAEVKFSDIDLKADKALICNSMHRFVLTEELRALLEDVFVFRQQQLLVQLYRVGAPDNILLEGVVEPSVLLYPFVNAMRFAVVLTPPVSISKTKRKQNQGDGVVKPIFAIISMCLLTPISEQVESLAKYTEEGSTGKLKFCRRTQSQLIMAPYPLLVERAYDDFDEWIANVVDYIVKHAIHEVADARNFFCCQAENVSNKILKLIALDFNKRIPTKNNIEFCNMLTIVYKELTERAYAYIKSCSEKDLSHCRKFEQSNPQYIIMIMNFVKVNYECGNNEIGDFLYEKIKERYPKNVDLKFYIFLYNVELGNFDEAKTYFELPLKERRIHDEYLIRILSVYIDYMQNLKEETTYNEAYEKLLLNLREFLKYYSNDTDGWILLYCLYKKSGYMPGMEFARWHYEDQYNNKPQRMLENVPKTRWRIYCNYDIQFNSVKPTQFYESVQLFQSIGAYKFAQIVFDEIAAECTDVERYVQQSTLKIFLDELDPQVAPRSFPSATAGVQRAFVELINGNIAYARGEKGTATEYYKYLTELTTDDDIEKQSFELGIRRFALEMIAEERWEEALNALAQCCLLGDSCMAASITMGQILYKLGRYEEALERFKYSTEYKIHIPDTWAYLALINLKLGRNFEALECWKYAKLNPDNVISDEILEELDKIDIKDIHLYVDKPV